MSTVGVTASTRGGSTTVAVPVGATSGRPTLGDTGAAGALNTRTDLPALTPVPSLAVTSGTPAAVREYRDLHVTGTTGVGSASYVRFVNCWFDAHPNGTGIVNGSSDQAPDQHLEFVDCTIGAARLGSDPHGLRLVNGVTLTRCLFTNVDHAMQYVNGLTADSCLFDCEPMSSFNTTVHGNCLFGGHGPTSVRFTNCVLIGGRSGCFNNYYGQAGWVFDGCDFYGPRTWNPAATYGSNLETHPPTSGSGFVYTGCRIDMSTALARTLYSTVAAWSGNTSLQTGQPVSRSFKVG